MDTAMVRAARDMRALSAGASGIPAGLHELCSARRSALRNPGKCAPFRPRRQAVTQPRASLAGDVPFAVAVALCIGQSASAKFLPASRLLGQGRQAPGAERREEEEPLFSLGDVRYGAMTTLSFIPFFNWLAWVLAWLDTRESKYAVFTAVYAAPYLRYGLDFSSDDSWLPVLCFIACVVHVQIEGQQPASDGASTVQDSPVAASKQGQIDDGEPAEPKDAGEEINDKKLKEWDAAFQKTQGKRSKTRIRRDP